MALAGLSLSVASFTNAAVDNALKSTTKTRTTDDTADMNLPDYTGVKQAVAVTEFTNDASYRSQWQLSQNLTLMLESALDATGRFILVARNDLGAVLNEQDLQASDRASAASDAAQTGLVRSARYIATGAITEVSEDTSGQKGGIGIGGFRIGASSAKASVAVVIQLIDTTTSEVVASERFRGEAGKSGLTLSAYKHGTSGNFGAFAKTPLAEAAQDCVDQAVTFIASQMEDYDIEGSVVTVAGNQIVVSLGENYGIQPGHRFLVRKEGEILTDPATGEVLDRFEGEVTATISAEKVREKIAYCSLVDGAVPERGDRVIVAK